MRFAIFLPLMMISIELAKFNKETMDDSFAKSIATIALILGAMDLIEFLNNLGKKK